MKNIDVLAIGDVVIDAFIRLNDAEILKNASGTDMLAVRYGDKVPFESVEICNAVGNSPNASVCVSRIGLSSALLSYVGNDNHGKDCVAELQKNGVETEYVRVENGKNTNYHYVLWYGVDRTILIKHEHFTYSLKGIAAPRWIYCSSLGENSLPFHTEIADFLSKNPETKLAFQPGTFQIKFGVEALKNIYSQTELFICNVEEAQKILSESSRDIKILINKIAELGPKIIVITDGFEGAYALDTQKGSDIIFMPIYPHTPVERTGAGDAYASTITSALATGESLETALSWAGINSMSVTQHTGAQKGLLSKEKILEYLAQAPAEYKAKVI